MHHLAREDAVALLGERAEELRARIDLDRGLTAALCAQGVKPLWLVEVEHALAMREAELAWVQQLARDVETGALPWDTAIPDGPEGADGASP